MKKIAFLDRDGVISVDKGYNFKKEDLELEETIVPALKILKNSGFQFIIVTNQSGIGRGYYTEENFWKYNNALTKILEKHGIKILKTYFSPFHPTEGIGKYKKKTACRKPGSGMIQRASQEFPIDIENSWIIGDKWSDVKAGKKFGLRAVLVLTGQAGGDEEKHKTEIEYIAKNPLEAAKYIIKDKNE